MSESLGHNFDKVIFANMGLKKEPAKRGLGILL